MLQKALQLLIVWGLGSRPDICSGSHSASPSERAVEVSHKGECTSLRHSLDLVVDALPCSCSDSFGVRGGLGVRIVGLLINVEEVNRPSWVCNTDMLDPPWVRIGIQDLTLGYEALVNESHQPCRLRVGGWRAVDLPVGSDKGGGHRILPMRLLHTCDLRSGFRLQVLQCKEQLVPQGTRQASRIPGHR